MSNLSKGKLWRVVWASSARWDIFLYAKFGNYDVTTRCNNYIFYETLLILLKPWYLVFDKFDMVHRYIFFNFRIAQISFFFRFHCYFFRQKMIFTIIWQLFALQIPEITTDDVLKVDLTYFIITLSFDGYSSSPRLWERKQWKRRAILTAGSMISGYLQAPLTLMGLKRYSQEEINSWGNTSFCDL